ncbi:hypothetical protein L9F63_009640 [Diploptera punctata]|uniref:RING-type domain-containing protein n=1 Tax=Diploptera punctata TaxID=6984 RepID=A0AAD8ERU1_DIPPU|nr:hypothetical protein L9F63_009640 [Diploptera punctata]
MAELARESFSTRNYTLPAEMYERCLKERGSNLDLYFAYGNSLAKSGKLREAIDVFSHSCKLQSGSEIVSQEKLRHFVTALMEAVIANSSRDYESRPNVFMCPICEGILLHPVTTSCGHTFCRKCLSKGSSRNCKICGQKFASGKVLEANVLMKGLTEKWWPQEIRAARLREEGNELFQRNEVEAALHKYGEAATIGECTAKPLYFVLAID